MNVITDPRMALTTMVYDGVFERFPTLRVATVEAMGSWVGEWIERFEYRYQYMKHTSQMKRPIREYFARNIWVNADPTEKLLPLIIPFVGDEKFFVGSDYPHAEGFIHPVQQMRELLAALPTAFQESAPSAEQLAELGQQGQKVAVVTVAEHSMRVSGCGT